MNCEGRQAMDGVEKSGHVSGHQEKLVTSSGRARTSARQNLKMEMMFVQFVTMVAS